MSLLFVAIWGYALNNYYSVEKFSRDDHRSTVTYLKRHALPGDLVVLDSSFDPAYLYYAGDEFPWIRVPQSLPPDNQQTLATLAKEAPNHQRVWLVMWDDYYVDPGRIVQRWFDSNYFRMDSKVFHGPIIVYGYLTAPPAREGPLHPSIPISADFEGQLSLLGYDVESQEGQPNRRIHLTLFWQAPKKVPISHSIFARLVNAAGQTLGAGDSQPVNGYLPTTVCEPGQTIRSEMDIWASPATPPGDYRLFVGVYDPITMRRLQTSNGDIVDLGPVRLSGRTVDLKGLDLQRAVNVQYGDSFQLVGEKIDQPWSGLLRVTLFWQARQKPPRRYTIFNHLVDSSGSIVAQKDGEPGGGSYPTDQWEQGEVIRDEYDITLPPDLNGHFHILTGIYNPDDGKRLPIRGWLPFRSSGTEYDLGIVHITH